MEEVPQTKPTPDHLLDWLHDSISIVPSILDDPYTSQWWEGDHLSQAVVDSSPNTSDLITASTGAGSGSSNSSTKKRKPSPNSATVNQNQRRRNHGDDNEEERCNRRTQNVKKLSVAKNGHNGQGNGSVNGSKDSRWAEQLLNPCAEAIAAGNLSRVQHYLCVLQELTSLSGDANYRLAAHGLQALTQHLSCSTAFPPSSGSVAPTFAATDPKLFHDSLIRFNEISPWFSFPNTLANASIVQTLSSGPCKDRSNLRIVDIGVSHGMQWPTLLEALTRRPGGPPALVRLTVVPSTSSETPVPFSVGPAGDDFPSRLLRYAKHIDLNLQIDQLDDLDGGLPLQALISQLCASRKNDETLVVCAQFRLHQLGHHHDSDDDALPARGEEEAERSDFLRGVTRVGPDLVVLSEHEGQCGCSRCGDYATGFSRRVEFLWRFLDSTSAAFKGRECEERRVLEGEAASVLGSARETKEGRERWCERMRRAGFVSDGFGEDATDGGRALLRKYDGNWEMKMESGLVCLCWKGQPVSFCSLWKLPTAQPVRRAELSERTI
ncbi:protein NODULATION SIGNALING PATHWAY 1-like [Aristolochia californica]|uniref:protein NODULATION SIGNALING PATHWAY 1-like n=1 Tax=Aristolochia californica TaxID=171875 RepID=UPI0035DDC483